MNPGVPALLTVTASSPGKDLRNANSRNHNGDGQNVLYADGHVEFQNNPFCGVNRDNIYTAGPVTPNSGGTTYKPMTPALPDVLLLPTENEGSHVSLATPPANASGTMASMASRPGKRRLDFRCRVHVYGRLGRGTVPPPQYGKHVPRAGIESRTLSRAVALVAEDKNPFSAPQRLRELFFQFFHNSGKNFLSNQKCVQNFHLSAIDIEGRSFLLPIQLLSRPECVHQEQRQNGRPPLLQLGSPVNVNKTPRVAVENGGFVDTFQPRHKLNRSVMMTIPPVYCSTFYRSTFSRSGGGGMGHFEERCVKCPFRPAAK